MRSKGEVMASTVAMLREQVALEHAKREEIRKSKKYIVLQAELVELTQELEALIEHIPDSAKDCAEAERQLIEEMTLTGADRFGNAVAHYRQRKSVNGGRLFSVLGNDIGLFMEIATVTQKNLTEFAKGNPDIKKELLTCVEDGVREIDSITFVDHE